MLLVLSSIVLLTLNAGVHSHLCLWSPMQRGTFDISKPGAHDCYHKPPPCGNINASSSSPRTDLTAGSMHTVLFQQNLNHYYSQAPGTLDISFAVGLNPVESDFRVLHSFSDYNSMNQITQTNFSVSVQLPNEPCEQCVLRVRYLSNNKDEDDRGTVFHQCSDIRLAKGRSTDNPQPAIVRQVEKPRQNDPHDCCAAKSFVSIFFQKNPSIDSSSEGFIYYDQAARQMRVVRIANGGRGNGTDDGTFDMWMNFTSGNQYYYNRNAKTCDLYGLDFWNDWCFGNTYNQSEDFVAADVPCTSKIGPPSTCHQWRNGDFLFEAYSNEQCLPASVSRTNGERIDYSQGSITPIPPEIFMPNPICLQQRKVKHASPKWMKLHA